MFFASVNLSLTYKFKLYYWIICIEKISTIVSQYPWKTVGPRN